MTASHLRLVVSNRMAQRSCSCRTWDLLPRLTRDLILADLMEWARLLHHVQLKLLARGEHVAICELQSSNPGQGRARRVMTELCAWADCARVTLELTPSGCWGSDVQRLIRSCHRLGFESNTEPEQPFRVRGDLIRHPVPGRGHIRL